MSQFKTHKVSDNNVVAKRVENKKQKILGEDWFPEVYSNIFLLAKKKSGKTTAIESILQRCASKNTVVILIVSTVNKDDSYARIRKNLEKRGVEVLVYDDIKDEDGNNVIQEFIDEQKEDGAYEDEERHLGGKQINIKPIRFPMMGAGGKTNLEIQMEQVKQLEKLHNEEPKKKVKVLAPEYIIVCDDLGISMRNKSLTQLLKTNRHYKTKVIMSAQNITDLEPAAIRQLDYVLVFGRLPEEKLEKLREELDLDISHDKFLELYKDATSEPYQFLYIGRSLEDSFRKGFTQEYEISE